MKSGKAKVALWAQTSPLVEFLTKFSAIAGISGMVYCPLNDCTFLYKTNIKGQRVNVRLFLIYSTSI